MDVVTAGGRSRHTRAQPTATAAPEGQWLARRRTRRTRIGRASRLVLASTRAG